MGSRARNAHGIAVANLSGSRRSNAVLSSRGSCGSYFRSPNLALVFTIDFKTLRVDLGRGPDVDPMAESAKDVRSQDLMRSIQPKRFDCPLHSRHCRPLPKTTELLARPQFRSILSRYRIDRGDYTQLTHSSPSQLVPSLNTGSRLAVVLVAKFVFTIGHSRDLRHRYSPA